MKRTTAGERRVEKMRHAVFGGKAAHGVHLIFHQRNKGRNDDGGTVHQQRRQLIAHALAAAGGHDDKRVFASQATKKPSLS